MKPQIYLASSVSEVAHSVARKLPKLPKEYELLFITTAADVEEGDKQWLEEDRNALLEAGFPLRDYTLTGKTSDHIQKDFESVTGLYFSGGDTFYLLHQLQETKSKELVEDLVLQGMLYIGSSAGSIIAGPDISPVRMVEAETWAKSAIDPKGIGLVDVVILPHWGSQLFKDRYFESKMIPSYSTQHKIILLNDFQYLEVLEKGYQIIDVRDE